MEKKVDKGEHYLPSQRKPKMLSQKTSRNPTEQTEESSQRTSFPIQTHIVHNICHGEQKPEIWYEAKATLERAIKDRRGEVVHHKKSEEDWPNEQHVYPCVHMVAMVRPVEGVLPL